jgi:cyclopropane fatty-acyl-phospholipid synthase-like methyltransferase
MNNFKAKERLQFAQKFFKREYSFNDNMYGGVHSLNKKAIIKLVFDEMELQLGEVVLEIGCGAPLLAFSLSAVSLAPVICTDLGRIIL